MIGWLQDLRYVARVLAKRPLYALASIAVFALGIGANSTVFSIVNGVFLRPLPYPDDDRLVIVYSSYPKMGLENAGTSVRDYLDRREQAPSLESLAMVDTGSRTLQSEGKSEPARGSRGRRVIGSQRALYLRGRESGNDGRLTRRASRSRRPRPSGTQWLLRPPLFASPAE
jgi:hypothetical protein